MDTTWRGPILRGVLKYLFKSVITRAVTPRWCALQCPGLLYGGAAQPRKAFLGTTQPLGWCFLFSASEFTKHFLIFFTFLSQNVSRVPIYRWQGRRWNQVPFPRSRNPASLGSSWAVMGEFWKLPSLLVSFLGLSPGRILGPGTSLGGADLRRCVRSLQGRKCLLEKHIINCSYPTPTLASPWGSGQGDKRSRQGNSLPDNPDRMAALFFFHQLLLWGNHLISIFLELPFFWKWADCIFVLHWEFSE